MAKKLKHICEYCGYKNDTVGICKNCGFFIYGMSWNEDMKHEETEAARDMFAANMAPVLFTEAIKLSLKQAARGPLPEVTDKYLNSIIANTAKQAYNYADALVKEKFKRMAERMERPSVTLEDEIPTISKYETPYPDTPGINFTTIFIYVNDNDFHKGDMLELEDESTLRVREDDPIQVEGKLWRVDTVVGLNDPKAYVDKEMLSEGRQIKILKVK